jgi:DinB superfamily
VQLREITPAKLSLLLPLESDYISHMNSRPSPAEYGAYYGKYISLVPDGDYLSAFQEITATTHGLLTSINEEKSLHRYVPEKWSIRECWLHVADTERIMCYRALRFARGDDKELMGFDQDPYVLLSGADSRSWRTIVEEYFAVRQATLAFFRNLPADAWIRTGTASGNAWTVRALAYTVAGHDLHHRKILREKYLAH